MKGPSPEVETDETPPTGQKSVSASGGKEAGGSFGRPTTQGRAAQTAVRVVHCTIPELGGWAALRVTRPRDSGWQGACREAWLRGGLGREPGLQGPRLQMKTLDSASVEAT